MVRTLRRWYVRSALALAVVLVFSGALPQATPTVLAEGPLLDVELWAPSYMIADSYIYYDLTVRNLTDETITDIVVYDPIPSNTTYALGGTFNAGENRAEFTLSSLAAQATYKFTLVVRTQNNLPTGTRIENKDLGAIYTIGNIRYGTSGYTGGVTIIEALGVPEAIYTNAQGKVFYVPDHSYKFQNYGGTSHDDDDLGADDIFMLFGPKVCTSGTTAATCVLSKPADDWRKKQIETWSNGHCDGFSMTSLRLFNQQPFRGKASPGDYQAGAARTYDLNFPQQGIENYITYYATTQLLAWSRIISSPVEIVNRLTNDFNKTPPVGYAVHIYKSDFSGGHSIVAYGVESDTSTNASRILVYDSNFPRQREYITVDNASNTWRYETVSTPGQPTNVYTGTATTGNLRLSPLAARDLPAGQYFECPFCSAPAVSLQDANPSQVTGEINVQYTGEGALQLVNDGGQATGEDYNTGAFVNTIPGAEVEPHLGGLGKEVPPRITVPFSETDETYYTAYVHGKTTNHATTGTLMIVGAGFSIGVNDLDLDSDELFEFRFSPDGDHISFRSTETITAPNIYIAHDPVHDGDPSVIFDVAGVTVHADENISIDLDPVLERMYFNDTGAEDERFTVTLDAVWPDGDTQVHTQTLHVPASATSAFIDFGAWDGLQEPPTFIDGVLQNPSVNHRLKLASMTGSYNVTPRSNAPAGVYTVRATFTNVTEVSLTDISFSVADLGTGNVLLNAQGGPAGAGAKVSVPPEALGADGMLHTNESFTLSFEVGLAQPGTSGLTVDANGLPHDWIHPNPAPSYDAHNASFVFAVRSSNLSFIPIIRR